MCAACEKACVVFSVLFESVSYLFHFPLFVKVFGCFQDKLSRPMKHKPDDHCDGLVLGMCGFIFDLCDKLLTHLVGAPVFNFSYFL